MGCLFVLNQEFIHGTKRGRGGKLMVVMGEGDKERVLELDDMGQGLGDIA